MNEIQHTPEVDKIALIDFSRVDMDKLNRHEVLGLYLLGQISRGRLTELWKYGYISSMELYKDVSELIAKFSRFPGGDFCTSDDPSRWLTCPECGIKTMSITYNYKGDPGRCNHCQRRRSISEKDI